MEKLNLNNTFEGGLVTDLADENTPKNVVSDALNMELITSGDDQYLYQNIKGNKLITNLPDYVENNIAYKFIPLGVKVYNNIAYILAGAFDDNGDFMAGTIGTFPSPDWNELNNGSGKSKLYNVFSPLHNFKSDPFSPGGYTEPFISKEFKFEKNRFIDIVIQGDFDRSVNIIFTDGLNKPKIINSRFKYTDNVNIVALADRFGDNDGNVYSNNDWDRIELIQNNNIPIKVDDYDVKEGGYLKGGGYRYFFKYVTQEGNATDVLYESPLFPISNGGVGINKGQLSSKSITFNLSNLDNSYKGIQVFFSHHNGEITEEVELFKINHVFTYSGNEVTIIHTGLESVTPIDISEISTSFTPIDTVKTIDIINDRLAFANIKSVLLEEDIKTLRETAEKMFIWERRTSMTNDYSDSLSAAKKLGYWRGEVYELAVVFLLTNKGLSPAFPITGMDNFTGIQDSFGGVYPNETIDQDGFSNPNLINHKGLFRTSNRGIIYEPFCDGTGRRHITYLEIDSSNITTVQGIDELISGFFIVRRKRIRNVLMQGMAVPTIKLPGSRPGIAPHTGDGHADYPANKRFLMRHNGTDHPTLALNAPYVPVKYDNLTTDMFTPTFSEVFAPQPTQLLNFVTHERTWALEGTIGNRVGEEEFYEVIDNKDDFKKLDKQKLAFYSCELDMNLQHVTEVLSGAKPAIEIQQNLNGGSPLGITKVGIFEPSAPNVDSPYNTIVRGVEKLNYDRSDFITIPSSRLKTSLINSGIEITANDSFTGKTDRAFGVVSWRNWYLGNMVVPYYDFPRISFPEYAPEIVNILQPCSRLSGDNMDSTTRYYVNDKDWWKLYSLVDHSYSTYIGLSIDLIPGDNNSAPTFRYKGGVTANRNNYINGNEAIACNHKKYEKYVNIGHLANIFKNSVGRWTQQDIRDIYKYDSNKPYFAVTERLPINTATVDIFRGDGFISKIFKRTTYKNGAGPLTATAGDAGAYGVGINKEEEHDFDAEKVLDSEKDDEGRGLYDNGQILELVAYSNINADIRSVERKSPEETAQVGYDRDFYPHREDMFSDRRPDSSGYNHGYTGEEHVIPYFRIEENAVTFNTEYPNRVLLSERNQVQEFYNSFRDLKGFNFRDYGIELGPIIKIISIKGILMSVHPKGVLGIGVDNRTLVAEGSDVYVDTAKALSPKAVTFSDTYGSIHPESIVKTDTSIIGVDYNASIVWLFLGDKIQLISEFAIKTLLLNFKNTIEAGGFDLNTPDVDYIPRVYSTYNTTKHTVYIAYVAEHPDTKEQYHVGSVTYSVVLQKWVSRMSEGNKFSMFLKSAEYTTGFSELSGIWQEDALIDPVTEEYIRTRIRGIDYEYGFEFLIDVHPTLEKIYENIRVLSNKVIPETIIYTTSGDVNDAAIDIWGDEAKEHVVVQDIVTRGESPRKSLRLGILDQNAYYRNSVLYIEVGKVGYTRKDAGNKRIRDSVIKVRFIYKGNKKTFIQAIISILSISGG